MDSEISRTLNLPVQGLWVFAVKGYTKHIYIGITKDLDAEKLDLESKANAKAILKGKEVSAKIDFIFSRWFKDSLESLKAQKQLTVKRIYDEDAFNSILSELELSR